MLQLASFRTLTKMSWQRLLATNKHVGMSRCSAHKRKTWSDKEDNDHSWAHHWPHNSASCRVEAQDCLLYAMPCFLQDAPAALQVTPSNRGVSRVGRGTATCEPTSCIAISWMGMVGSAGSAATGGQRHELRDDRKIVESSVRA